MSDFPEYLRSKAVEGLQRLSDAERADVYVVSFFVYDEYDDPRLPVLTVGANTERQVQFATDPPPGFVKPNPWWTPTDEAEARWNYAFWLQNELAVVGDEAADQHGAGLRRSWLETLDLWFDEFDYTSEAFERGELITKKFVDVCVATVQDIHQSGLLVDLFARPIPVIVHELEYYEAIADQNVAANGPALAAGLVSWIHAA